MKSKSVLAHAILAVGGLTLAYLVWTDDAPVVDENEVTIFECAPDELSGAELVVGEQTFSLAVERDGDDPVVWITTVREPEEGERTSTRFVGNDAAVSYLEQLAPLRARRSLGELSDEQRDELGFDEPDGTLTVRCGDRRASFTLGDRAFGEGDRYVRRAEGGPVYLVANARLQPLQSASAQLMQRGLHTFEWTEVETMRVRGYGQSKALRQRNRLDPQRAEWVDAAQPDRRNELYGNWFSRYPRMRVQAYLEEGGHPGSDLEGMSAPSEELMRLEMLGEDGEALGHLEMVRVPAEPPAYYARTETTRSWVRIPTSVAQSFAEDLRPVLGLDPVEEEAPTEAAPTEAAPTEAAPTEAAPTEAAPSEAAPAAPAEGAPSEAPPAPEAPAPGEGGAAP